MRCNNCGYDNAADKMKCEKCNAPLQGSMIDNSKHSNQGHDSSDGIAGTIKGQQIKSDPWDCPGCGRPLIPGTVACNYCGYKMIKNDTNEDVQPPKPDVQPPKPDVQPPKPDVQLPKDVFKKKGLDPFGTIDPYQKGFILKPVATDYETEFESVTFKANTDKVALGRADLEPDNQTISSNQAIMTNKNGKWYIKDESKHKTTYVLAADFIELQEGDVILIGNRKFVFST
jgi:hypothetical protein